MSENSLKAAIAGNLLKEEEVTSKSAPKIVRTKKPKPAPKPSRQNTVLIGGHFPPEVKKQLRLIAAEDDATHQGLLEEALNLLFVKKGKKKIEEL